MFFLAVIFSNNVIGSVLSFWCKEVRGHFWTIVWMFCFYFCDIKSGLSYWTLCSSPSCGTCLMWDSTSNNKLQAALSLCVVFILHICWVQFLDLSKNHVANTVGVFRRIIWNPGYTSGMCIGTHAVWMTERRPGDLFVMKKYSIGGL